MKGRLVLNRLILGLLLALFLFMSSCSGAIDENIIYQVGLTQTVAAYTPTSIITPDPMENRLVTILNPDLASTNQLSQVLEAKYYVLKVDFLVNDSQVPEQLFIEIHCECVNNDSCCNVKRTFVVLIDAMKSNPEPLIQLLPPGIKTLQVSCYDHEEPIGTISTPWYLMMDYFRGNINGLQLGGEINKLFTPTP
jgi:hypothetical protein